MISKIITPTGSVKTKTGKKWSISSPIVEVGVSGMSAAISRNLDTSSVSGISKIHSRNN